MSDLRRPSDSDHPDDLLAGHVDGMLTATERADLQAHLDGCERCRAELELAESAASALRELPELDPPWGLGREAIEESRKGAGRPGARRWAAVAGVAAAGVLIVGLAVSVLRGPQVESPTAAPLGTTSQAEGGGGNDNGASTKFAPTPQEPVVDRQNRSYATDDVEALASSWATKAKTIRTAPPAPAPTAAGTSGAATSAPTTAAISAPATSGPSAAGSQ